MVLVSEHKKRLYALLAYIAISDIKEKYRIYVRGFVQAYSDVNWFELIVPEHAVAFLSEDLFAAADMKVFRVDKEKSVLPDQRILSVRIIPRSGFDLSRCLNIRSVCEAYCYKLYDRDIFMYSLELIQHVRG